MDSQGQPWLDAAKTKKAAERANILVDVTRNGGTGGWTVGGSDEDLCLLMLSIPKEFVFHSVFDEGVVWTALPRNEDWTKKKGEHCIIIIIIVGCEMSSFTSVDWLQSRSTCISDLRKDGAISKAPFGQL